MVRFSDEECVILLEEQSKRAPAKKTES